MEESVFECELEERVYTDMCSGLEGLLSDGDKLLIYVLPGNAVRQALYSVS